MWWWLVLGCGGSEVLGLAQAPASSASRMEIQGASIDLTGLSAYDRTCTRKTPVATKGGSPCVDHHFYVAPVRDGSDGPVLAWVTCPERAGTTVEACRAWLEARPVPSGRVMWRHRANWDSGWAKAIAASGLPSAERAPVLLIE
ncbi:MAG: hypothetical protein R3F61_37700 [Myxococcota bacterium]